MLRMTTAKLNQYVFRDPAKGKIVYSYLGSERQPNEEVYRFVQSGIGAESSLFGQSLEENEMYLDILCSSFDTQNTSTSIFPKYIFDYHGRPAV